MKKLSAHDKEILAYTLLGEAAGEGKPGMEAVMHVIKNRAESGVYPESFSKVALQHRGGVYQFSTWSPAHGNNPEQKFSKNSASYKTALQAIDAVLGGAPDPTGKALNYLNPDIATPSKWFKASATAGTTKIGNHLFASTEKPGVLAAGSIHTPVDAMYGVAGLAGKTDFNQLIMTPGMQYAGGAAMMLDPKVMRLTQLQLATSAEGTANIVRLAPSFISEDHPKSNSGAIIPPGLLNPSKGADAATLPASVRTLIGTVMGDRTPLTQANFTKEELAVLSTVVSRAEAAGRNYFDYRDYKPAPGTGNVLNNAKDIETSLMTTLGAAKFTRQPDGSILISDKYDFGSEITHDSAPGTSAPQLLMNGLVWGGVYGMAHAAGELAVPEGQGRTVSIHIPLPAFTSEDHPKSNAVVPLPRTNPMIEAGNIDLNKRQVFNAPDGSYRTENSISVGTDKGETLIPTIIGGKQVSEAEAIRHYQQTGENLGTFNSIDAANTYAEQLHQRQAEFYSPQRVPTREVSTVPIHVVQADATAGGPSQQGFDLIQRALKEGVVAAPQVAVATSNIRIDPITASPVMAIGRNSSGSPDDRQVATQLQTQGYIKTTPQAGVAEFQIPAGYRPAVADAIIAKNVSGSPDDRKVASNATPFHNEWAPWQALPTLAPGKPVAQAAPVPHSPSGTYTAYKIEDRLVTTYKTVKVDAVPLGGGANQTLQDIHDKRDAAQVLAMQSAAPTYKKVPVTTTVQVRVPVQVDRPVPRAVVPVAAPVIKAAPVAAPAPAAISNFDLLNQQGNYDPGSPNSNFEKDNGMGSVTKSMAGSSRWNTGY